MKPSERYSALGINVLAIKMGKYCPLPGTNHLTCTKNDLTLASRLFQGNCQQKATLTGGRNKILLRRIRVNYLFECHGKYRKKTSYSKVIVVVTIQS